MLNPNPSVRKGAPHYLLIQLPARGTRISAEIPGSGQGNTNFKADIYCLKWPLGEAGGFYRKRKENNSKTCPQQQQRHIINSNRLKLRAAKSTLPLSVHSWSCWITIQANVSLNFIKALKTGMFICSQKRMGRYPRIQIISACTGLCQ